MNDATPDNREDLPAAVLKEAAVWHARLREPEFDRSPAAARRAAFEQWLDADPRHRRALWETERLWRALKAPAVEVMAEEPAAISPVAVEAPSQRRTAPPVISRVAAIAACVLVLAATGLIWHDDILVGLRSDYATQPGELAPLALDDGSRITLNTDSAVAVNLGPNRRQVRLLRGEAWFDVSPDDPRTFVVETSQGSVRVTGTSFDVRLDGDRTIVSLTEGEVELRSAAIGGEPPFILQPGQQAIISRTDVSAATAFDRTVVTAWLRGQLVFYDTPLSDVVAALNRHRRGRIVIMNGELVDLKVSGIFRTGETDTALAVIADTLPVHVTRLTDYLVLLR
jgi:transmembrane sensor